MREVAEEANVSIATVSLVVNDKKNARIGKEARRRVNEAIEKLGYRPNALAKSLVSGSSRFIGLVADAIATTPFAGQIIHGAQDEAWKHGYVLLVANTEGDPEVTDDAINMMVDHQAIGILYSTWYHREIERPAALGSTPTVFVNCYTNEASETAVVPDEEQGGYTATSLLTRKGHQRIAFLNSTEDAPSTVGRLAGYRRALADAGLPFDPSLVLDVTPEQEGGYRATTGVLDRADRPTAVFCYNDRVAMGLYDGVKERGLRIPNDLAVVGFDDQEVIAAHLRPTLTSVALPQYELGVRGVRALLAALDGDPHPGVQRITCPPALRHSI
ncbi:LacI family DNA-binding transcriptional regulator [uncultured Leifsonia sp.]|uniref:LacI family DNA-binding transcriptional regulator n=1 Tax=uncultured Leifsonia sp. TaxID=340359 RepID=UPI0028D2A323|nr:LacI family DNA-binding transcriptional regulator [uncultured Leifsonia sp.]